ncbi:uncharacterized protein RAG0_16842 [Rhynchosporium agropyri]|uniref:Uncharacterized protein n=1 Tax=Rhynchosporium agropyri TaxID=914238 RepID=A0A1E1LS72_9HELO|nr:uncharacterized protein RAG0_16842 [Rhynchosporium agropyri]
MKSPLPSTHFQCDALPPYLRGSPSTRYPPHKPPPSNSLPTLPCSLKLHRSIDRPKQGFTWSGGVVGYHISLTAAFASHERVEITVTHSEKVLGSNPILIKNLPPSLLSFSFFFSF